MPSIVAERSAKIETRGEAAPAVVSRSQSFDPFIKTAHWLTLFLIVAVFASAALIDEVPDAWKLMVIQLHRSLGLAIWIVTVMRLLWRQFARFPDWPANMSRAMRGAAHSMEYLLYSLLLLQPILGLLYSNAKGGRINLFFLVHLPPLIDRDDELGEQLIAAHGVVANLLLAVIALHAATALFHHFIRRDRTLDRMLPKASRRSGAKNWQSLRS
jgi:cytochrome b561